MPFQVAPKPSRLDLVGFDIPEDINRWGFSRGAGAEPPRCGESHKGKARAAQAHRLRRSPPSGSEGGSRAAPLHGQPLVGIP